MNKFKKKSIELAKKIAKDKASWKCEKCGRTKKQGWKMDGAHIIPVEYGLTCANPENILCLCATCHRLGRNAAHENPVPFTRWLEETFPGRYDKLWEIARKSRPIYDSEWKETFKNLKIQWKALTIAGGHND